MNKCRINRIGTLITNDQSSKVLQPGVGSLDDPAMFVTPQLASVLVGGSTIVATCWNDRLDTTVYEEASNAVAVISTVSNQALGLFMKSVFVELIERRFEESDFSRGRRVHVNSERSTRAICQNHKLCSLAPLGLADFCPPFFAETKVPSMKHSFQQIIPASFNWLRKARHRLRSVPSAAHSLKRRWTVLGFP